jgi:CheY-like chemotaxis protein
LEKFLSSQFDLIVTDRAMPEMSGDKMVEAIKQADPNVPIILVTGFGALMEDSGEHPRGVDLILRKPVTINELRQAIVHIAQDRNWKYQQESSKL